MIQFQPDRIVDRVGLLVKVINGWRAISSETLIMRLINYSGSRKSEVGSGKWEVGSRESGVGSREQGVGSRE